MKKITDIFFSMVSTVILLLVFAVGIGYATFIENEQGTEIARKLVYNAVWFEFLLVLLSINLIGSALQYNIFNKRKFSILLFHLSFILILIGAGITRYFGSEGMMHIREGETTNEISSDKTSLKIEAEYNGLTVEKIVDASFSVSSSNILEESVKIGDKIITVRNELYIPNSIETLESDENGEPIINVFVMNENSQGQDILLAEGESNESNGVKFAFADSTSKADILFAKTEDHLLMKSTSAISKIGMMESSEEIFPAETFIQLQDRTIYKTDKLIFVLKKYLPKAKKSLTMFTPEMNKTGVMIMGKNAGIFNVSDGNSSEKVNVLWNENEVSNRGTCYLNDVKVSISYGNIAQKLPFSITLRDFQLDRYPGSNSPSSYASEIIVTDTEMKTNLPFRIFMNNILNYRGYRFFQSLYDTDEKGTILSVNKDYWGTLVTYAGYLFMLIGMILTLFNTNSRFFTVIKLSNQLQQKRKAAKLLLIAGLVILSGSEVSAQNFSNKKAHLEALNSLLIQDEALGRIEPLSTYASDLFRKVAKKTSYNNMSSLEVILGMCTNPSKWQNEPIIKIAHDELAKELGASKNFVSYIQLFDSNGAYKIAEKVENAYQKNPSERNQYEKELINVDERVNIVSSIFSGTILTIFPEEGNETGKWHSVTDVGTKNNVEATTKNKKGDVCPMTGKTGMTNLPVGNELVDKNNNKQMQNSGDAKRPVTGEKDITGKLDKTLDGSIETMDAVLSENAKIEQIMGDTSDIYVGSDAEQLLSAYFNGVLDAERTGDWRYANSALLGLKNYQLLNGGTQLPSKNKVKFEVLYNKLSVFLTLALLYGFLGIILLGLHIKNILKYNSKIDNFLEKSIYPLAIMFLVYTLGLAIRWYISGHAPWSNGYEAMIFVGWGAGLSGLVFAGKSPITLAMTSLLSAIALSVAGMSWMNPEITNLVPVLKSYWLVIHVAVITSSYGFFAMAALLGLFNLCLMMARNSKNELRLNESILEFGYIIELALTIGLFMLTVGTFLGGIWANESWGRYWGWDSKETWALVSVLIYSVILHLRNIPKVNNPLVFNTVTVVGFGTVIMTFVGVNYYLSGMHSYGQGTPPPIPTAVYFVLIALAGIVFGAYRNEKSRSK